MFEFISIKQLKIRCLKLHLIIIPETSAIPKTGMKKFQSCAEQANTDAFYSKTSTRRAERVPGQRLDSARAAQQFFPSRTPWPPDKPSQEGMKEAAWAKHCSTAKLAQTAATLNSKQKVKCKIHQLFEHFQMIVEEYSPRGEEIKEVGSTWPRGQSSDREVLPWESSPLSSRGVTLRAMPFSSPPQNAYSQNCHRKGFAQVKHQRSSTTG